MRNKLKRLAAIDDICGYGKCSLGIIIPVVSAAGIEVCSIPTGIFSTHTPLEGYTKLDTSEILDDYIKSWKKQNIEIDAIYTGYLANKQQVFSTLQLFADHPNTIKFVDPVLGDFGKLYIPGTEELIDGMKTLIKHADIITPNYTEACFLTNFEFRENPSEEDINKVLGKLLSLGAKNVVLTGIVKDKNIANYFISKNDDIKKTFKNEYFDHKIHGAGDLFSACIIANYLNCKNIENSISFASKFLYNAVKFTIEQPGFENRGISFEPLLDKITKLKEIYNG